MQANFFGVLKEGKFSANLNNLLHKETFHFQARISEKKNGDIREAFERMSKVFMAVRDKLRVTKEDPTYEEIHQMQSKEIQEINKQNKGCELSEIVGAISRDSVLLLYSISKIMMEENRVEL